MRYSRILPALPLLALSNALLAQSIATFPPGYGAKEGPGVSYNFGAWSNTRYAFLDATQRGTAMTIKEIKFRRDYRSYSSTTGRARGYSSARVLVYPCNYDGHTGPSREFAKIPTAAPKTVFNKSVTFPAQTGFPSTQPAKPHACFPFSSSYAYDGKSDLGMDFTMTGGTAPGTTWGTKTLTNYLDGVGGETVATGTQTYYGKRSHTGGCRDSTATNTLGAFSFFYIRTHTRQYVTKACRSSVTFDSLSYYSAPNANAIHAVSPVAATSGIVFPGVGCNKLYLNPTLPLLLFTFKADNTGTSGGLSGGTLAKIPYRKQLEGLPVSTQVAWDDSKGKGVRLTNAVTAKIPTMPAGVPERLVVYTKSATQTSGTVTNAWRYMPLMYVVK